MPPPNELFSCDFVGPFKPAGSASLTPRSVNPDDNSEIYGHGVTLIISLLISSDSRMGMWSA